jgi:hypothetical protein
MKIPLAAVAITCCPYRKHKTADGDRESADTRVQPDTILRWHRRVSGLLALEISRLY